MNSDEDKFAELGRYDLLNKGVCGKATSRVDIIGQNGNDGLHYGQVDTENCVIPNDSSAKQIGGRHYTEHKIQPWDIIDEYHLNFYEGNVLKYLLRNKGNREEDIKKAIHYLEKILESRSG